MKITPEMINKLINFCIVTDKDNDKVLKERNQNKILRRLKQNFCGKVAELFVNDWFDAGQEEYIMTILSQGAFRSDLKCIGKGWGVKSQDPESITLNGKNRFVFGTADKFKSDIYCGILVTPELSNQALFNLLFNQNILDKSNDYDTFTEWAKCIETVKCEWGFCCKKDAIVEYTNEIMMYKEGLWDKIKYGLKEKTVLMGDKLPFESRIDKKNNFPKNKSNA